MKKKLLLTIVASLSIAVSTVGALSLASSNDFKIGATDNYTCELPAGYHEIQDVIDYLNDDHNYSTNPYTFRGTVTRRFDDVIYVQRVNQTTGKLDAIRVENVNTHANYVNEGNVVDISGGTLYLLDDSQPTLILQDSENIFKAFDINPTGFGPKQYATFDEWVEDAENNTDNIWSRLINVHMAKVVGIGTTDFNGTDYDYISLEDFINKQQWFVALQTDDNEAVKAVAQEAMVNAKSVSINFIFTIVEPYTVLTLNKVDDVVLGDEYLDTNIVSSVFTSNFKYYDSYNDEIYSDPFPAYYLNGKGDVPYGKFDEVEYTFMSFFYGNNSLFYMYEALDPTCDEYYYYNPDVGFERYCYVINPVEDYFAIYRDLYNLTNGVYTSNDGVRYIATGNEDGYCVFDVDKSKVLNPKSAYVVYDFGAYNIDMVKDKYDNIYIPLTLLVDVLSINSNRSFAFNGADFYYLNTFEAGNPLYDDYYITSPRLDSPTRSAAMAEYSYNEFAFLVEHFYGLRDNLIPEDSSFDAMVNSMGLKEMMKSTDTADYEYAVADFVCQKLSDGHASYSFVSPYCDSDRVTYEGDNFGNYGIGNNYYGGRNPRVAKLYSDLIQINTARNTAGKSVGLEIVDNVGVIRFDSFKKLRGNTGSIDIDSYSYEVLHNNDSYLLFMKAFKEIEEYNTDPDNLTKVNKIVVDITRNGGGALDSLPWLEAFFTDDPSITFKDWTTGEIVETHYQVDLDHDGVLGDTYKNDYDGFYLLTSNFSFSCGNYFPTVMKEKGAMTLIGETSGGGECAVAMFATADGTIIRDSSNFHLGYYDYVNEEFVGNDGGITPDYAYPREYFYDMAYLVNFVNNH